MREGRAVAWLEPHAQYADDVVLELDAVVLRIRSHGIGQLLPHEALLVPRVNSARVTKAKRTGPRAETAPPRHARAHPHKRPLKTLERVLSKAGLGSRVEARQWVSAGRVAVNGRVICDPDHWVDMERDRVRFDGQPLTARERVYLLLYKPTGYLTTYKDPEGRPTVYDLMEDVGTFVTPVGRLDLDTSGLLLMTNDNQFAEHVTNPLPTSLRRISSRRRCC